MTAFVPRHCNNCERQNSLKYATEHIFCGTWNFEQCSEVVINAPKHTKKLSRAAARLCGVETAILPAWRVVAVSLLEAQSPLKNLVHGCMRT